MLCWAQPPENEPSRSRSDQYFEKVRDVRVRYPEMTNVVKFMSVYQKMPALERAAIILEDSFITQTLREFVERDLNSDGDLTFGTYP
jgi:hypothetical protein